MTLRTTKPRRARRVKLGLAALTTSLLIAACGSSAATTTTTTSTSTTASASASGTANRTAFQKCLQQHGVTIPSHPTGSGTSATHTVRPPVGGGGAANPTAQAAFKACGATGQHTKSA